MSDLIYGVIYAEGHTSNSIFNREEPTGRYEPTGTARMLRETFLKENISINTQDVPIPFAPAFEIYVEGQPLRENNLPKFLIATENPFINTLNRNKSYLAGFQRVFCWDSNILQLENAVKIYIPHELDIQPFAGWGERTDFVCMINSNKWSKPTTGSNLYEERLRIIRWYESNYPTHFSLWGYGWNKPVPRTGFFGKTLRNLESVAAKASGVRPFPSYRGAVEKKGMVLGSTKFCFCYENSSLLKNYITEKIFDAMVWGCIPIYFGAPNVDELIPSGTFIDSRRFQTLSTLHAFLESIDSVFFNSIQSRIHKFLNSSSVKLFSTEQFSTTVVRTVVDYLSHNYR